MAFNTALKPLTLVEIGSNSAHFSPLLLDPLVLITFTVFPTFEKLNKLKPTFLSVPSVLVTTITSFFHFYPRQATQLSFPEIIVYPGRIYLENCPKA